MLSRAPYKIKLLFFLFQGQIFELDEITPVLCYMHIEEKPADYARFELRCQCWGGECSGRSKSKKTKAVC